MRHTFLYYLARGGVATATAQAIAGHASAEMTLHYQNHATLEDKRAAVASLPQCLNAFSPAGGDGHCAKTELLRLVQGLGAADSEKLLYALTHNFENILKICEKGA